MLQQAKNTAAWINAVFVIARAWYGVLGVTLPCSKVPYRSRLVWCGEKRLMLFLG